MALKPGSTLFNGQYHIQGQLGRGGFGFVYLAHDTLLDEQVAIKELIPALVGDEIVLKRFLAEAKATMRLAHKRIVRTHNVFAEGGNYYIVMEYMPGGSLEDRLRECGNLPVDEAVQIAAQVCEGLASAHEEGVVHCDLKPANILFAADGSAKVADFGIAHVSEQMLSRSWMTPTGFVAGTLPYMSPEQADGLRDDPRLDLFALGAVLYRALTARTYLEFDKQETPRAQMENLQRIYTEQPAAPSTHCSGIPPWLDAVIVTALAKRPEERYASASALRNALLLHQPALAQPVSLPPLTPTHVFTEKQLTTVAHAPTPGAPRAKGSPVLPVATRKTPLPAWLWPAAAASAGLFMLLIIAIAVIGKGRERGALAGAATVTSATFPGTVVAIQAPTRTAESTVAPTETDTPTNTPTNTPEPTITSTSTSTDTPLPTATSTSSPTPTAIPTATFTSTPAPPTKTPKPKAPAAGATRKRSKDGMVMVYVSAGEFLMGSSKVDTDATQWDAQQHAVYLDAFWIDKTEITNTQYHQCVAAGACRAPITCTAGQPTYNDNSKSNHPAVCVSWTDAKTYCRWAGARLPNEAEWEKAARGTDARKYPWGNNFDASRLNFCDRNCTYSGNDPGANDDYAMTAPIGSYPAGASTYGALDMAGNVHEWVADYNPYSGGWQMHRGGSWNSDRVDVRSATYGRRQPGSTSDDIGFRCVADLPGE